MIAGLAADEDLETQRVRLAHGAAVVVATPGRLVQHLDSGSFDVALTDSLEMVRLWWSNFGSVALTVSRDTVHHRRKKSQ